MNVYFAAVLWKYCENLVLVWFDVEHGYIPHAAICQRLKGMLEFPIQKKKKERERNKN